MKKEITVTGTEKKWFAAKGEPGIMKPLCRQMPSEKVARRFCQRFQFNLMQRTEGTYSDGGTFKSPLLLAR